MPTPKFPSGSWLLTLLANTHAQRKIAVAPPTSLSCLDMLPSRVLFFLCGSIVYIVRSGMFRRPARGLERRSPSFTVDPERAAGARRSPRRRLRAFDRVSIREIRVAEALSSEEKGRGKR